ncbi:MAG: hypothetical protein HYR84_16600 [Planctomycetes bacterium]|nr:hypothetical protein [Planctomycetota bacterium]
MPAGSVPGPTDPTRSKSRVDDGTMCIAASPTPQPLGAPMDAVTTWDLKRKLLEAARRVTSKLPAEMRDQFASLFNAQNLAITGGVLAAWGASHLIGVGEVVDIILLVVGVVTIGLQAIQAARDIGKFLTIAAHAKSDHDLDIAANHLARAVVTIGVAAFIALIMKAGAKFKAPSPILSVESKIVTEVRAILSSSEMAQIRTARAAGKSITVKVGRRTLQYEPGVPASGMTMFGEDGFILGRDAFKSEAELVKTLLHELFRLETSGVGKGAIPQSASSMQDVVSAETKAAAAFAEKIYAEFFASHR